MFDISSREISIETPFLLEKQINLFQTHFEANSSSFNSAINTLVCMSVGLWSLQRKPTRKKVQKPQTVQFAVKGVFSRSR